MSDDEPERPPPGEFVECGMCHRQVPVRQTMTLGGRVLCFGCASGWFDEDEGESDA